MGRTNTIIIVNITFTLSDFLHFRTRARTRLAFCRSRKLVFSKLTLLSLSVSYFQPSKRKASKNVHTVGRDLVYASASVTNATT